VRPKLFGSGWIKEGNLGLPLLMPIVAKTSSKVGSLFSLLKKDITALGEMIFILIHLRLYHNSLIFTTFS
jgi:hypothetical protein